MSVRRKRAGWARCGLLSAAFAVACGGSADVPPPAAAPDAVQEPSDHGIVADPGPAPAQDTEAVDSNGILDPGPADATPDTAADPGPNDTGAAPADNGPAPPEEPCVPEGVSTVPWSAGCSGGQAVGLFTGPHEVTALAAVGGGDGAQILVAWAAGGSIAARLVGPDGQPSTGDIAVGGSPSAISSLEAVAIPDGWAVLWSAGSLDGSPTPEDVTAHLATIGADGVVQSFPTPFESNLQLGRGVALAESGYRLWGLRDSAFDDQVERVAMYVRLSFAGTVDGLHFMQNAQNFDYLRLHSDPQTVHVPFTRPEAAVPVSYFLQEVETPGCGLPEDSGVTLGAGQTMVTTGFVNGRSVWIVRDPSAGCDESGGGRMLVLNPFDNELSEAALPLGPSDHAALTLEHTSGDLFLVDVHPPFLRAVQIRPAKLLVSDAHTVGLLPENETVTQLRIASGPQGIQAIWATQDDEGANRVSTRLLCP